MKMARALGVAGLLFVLSAAMAYGQPARIWKTGQTQSYAAADDGALQRGVAWPEPRFTDHGDGTVTDNLTGLMWLKDANCFENMAWQAALDKVSDLNADPGGYSCGGYTAGYTDWRLPNRKELRSLTDFSETNPALPSGHPFLNVQSDEYWSSTSCVESPVEALRVGMDDGSVGRSRKTERDYYVWPVRAGFVYLDIKANGSDGPIAVLHKDPVSISITLDPGDRVGDVADWWIDVSTPFAPPCNWYTYVYGTGWMPGVKLSARTGLFALTSFEVLNMNLPVGNYTFHFSLDDPDGAATGPWWGRDSVVVNVVRHR
jgi:hypothetical protein